MARVPEIKRLRVEDITDPPDWVGDAFNVLNTFMEATVTTLNAQVDFDVNIRSKIVDNTFTTLATYTPAGDFEAIFIKGLLTRVKGVLVLRVVKTDTPDTIIKTAVCVGSWREDTSGNIKIQYISGLENSTRYTVRFLVI